MTLSPYSADCLSMNASGNARYVALNVLPPPPPRPKGNIALPVNKRVSCVCVSVRERARVRARYKVARRGKNVEGGRGEKRWERAPQEEGVARPTSGDERARVSSFFSPHTARALASHLTTVLASPF